MSYQELDQYSDALAAGLVEKPTELRWCMPNIAAFVISYYGVLKAGGVVAATNPTYPADKMQFQVNDCDAPIVITMSLFYNTVKQIQAKTKVKKVIVTNVKEYLPGTAKLLFTLAKREKRRTSN